MSYINRGEAIRLIMEYQGGAMDKPTARKVLEGMDGVDICKDTISRQAAIDAVDSETVSTNPEHFKSSEKFIKFMDDADIASFGKWQWANGFNTAVVATKILLKKLPSAQPEIIRCKDCKHKNVYYIPPKYDKRDYCVKHNRVVDVADFCSCAERRTE